MLEAWFIARKRHSSAGVAQAGNEREIPRVAKLCWAGALERRDEAAVANHASAWEQGVERCQGMKAAHRAFLSHVA